MNCRGPSCKARPPALLLLVTAIVTCGCRSLPLVPTAEVERAPTEFRMEVKSPHGPVNPREARAILARLKAEAPDGDALARHLAIEQAVADSPLYTSNRITILHDGEQTFPAMFAALRNAKRSIELEYFIFEDVECAGEHLRDLLIEKRRQGVSISVIYDAVGSMATPGAFRDDLNEAGVRLLEFHPVNPLHSPSHFALNDRDHRKMLIVDGHVGIVGGINMSHTYQNPVPSGGSGPSAPKGADQEHWRDTDIQIEGPAVAELEAVFRAHWARESGNADYADQDRDLHGRGAEGSQIVRIIASAPSRAASRFYVTLLTAIESAATSIRMTTGYFVPTHQELEALVAAARRGVDVRLMLPSHSDSRSALAAQRFAYGELLRAGVKIYERGDGVLHSKTVVVDGVWAAIGSSNVDHRSALFNDEVDAVIVGRETGEAMEQMFQGDMAHALLVDRDRWRRRPASEHVLEAWSWLVQRLL